MGAWGYEPFESDQALDWVGNEITDPVMATLNKAIDGVLDIEQSAIDLRPASEAQAAAFMFTSLVGHPSRVIDINPEDAVAFTKKAVRALLVLNDTASDWDDADAYKKVNDGIIEKLHAIQSDPDRAMQGTTLLQKIAEGLTPSGTRDTTNN